LAAHGEKMFFSGTFEHSLDSKNRVTIPARFRQALANGVAITKGKDKCLVGYPIERWKEIGEELVMREDTEENRREKRKFFASTVEAIPDKQGRVLLPPHLREYAGITSEVVILGTGDCFEIWDKAAYEQEILP